MTGMAKNRRQQRCTVSAGDMVAPKGGPPWLISKRSKHLVESILGIESGLYLETSEGCRVVLIDGIKVYLKQTQEFDILFKTDDPNAPQMPPLEWFMLMGIGNEGVEMFLCTADFDEASTHRHTFTLTARFNSHRNISVYAWSGSDKLTWDDAEAIQDEVISSATKLF